MAWLLDKMVADPKRGVDIVAEQFDNETLERGLDETILSRNLDQALDFIDQNAKV